MVLGTCVFCSFGVGAEELVGCWLVGVVCEMLDVFILPIAANIAFVIVVLIVDDIVCMED